MKILFCGSLLPDKYEGKVHYLSAAGNQYQNNLLKALRRKHEIKILSYINYPIEVDEEIIKIDCINADIEAIFTSYETFAVIYYRKKMKKYIAWADIVITYNIMYAWFGAPSYAKRLKKPSIVIIADYTSPSETKSILRKIYALLIVGELKKYTKAVMLSPETEKYLLLKQKKILINGCIQWSNFKDISRPSNEGTINLVYTGGLSYNNGTDKMLAAFSKIKDKTIRLFICGQGGPQQKLAEQYAENDSRIYLLGFISRERYYDLLKTSHILINPRNMNVQQNNVNFPSKVLEYLASGRYVVSTKFKGYKTYCNYFIFTESTTEGLYEGMVYAINKVKKDPCGKYKGNRKAAQKLDWGNMADQFLILKE